MTKRQLKRKVKTLMVAGAVVQVTLFAAAQIDITRRGDDEIRGPKFLWRLICLVNVVGPILYFAIGRLAPTEPTIDTPEVTPIVA